MCMFRDSHVYVLASNGSSSMANDHGGCIVDTVTEAQGKLDKPVQSHIDYADTPASVLCFFLARVLQQGPSS
jgi:hypothetical protein